MEEYRIKECAKLAAFREVVNNNSNRGQQKPKT